MLFVSIVSGLIVFYDGAGGQLAFKSQSLEEGRTYANPEYQVFFRGYRKYVVNVCHCYYLGATNVGKVLAWSLGGLKQYYHVSIFNTAPS